jgi:hypothetical protein
MLLNRMGSSGSGAVRKFAIEWGLRFWLFFTLFLAVGVGITNVRPSNVPMLTLVTCIAATMLDLAFMWLLWYGPLFFLKHRVRARQNEFRLQLLHAMLRHKNLPGFDKCDETSRNIARQLVAVGRGYGYLIEHAKPMCCSGRRSARTDLATKFQTFLRSAEACDPGDLTMLHVAAFNGFLYDEQTKKRPSVGDHSPKMQGNRVPSHDQEEQATVPTMHGNRLSQMFEGDDDIEASALALHSLETCDDKEGFEMTTSNDFLPKAPNRPQGSTAQAEDDAHQLVDC